MRFTDLEQVEKAAREIENECDSFLITQGKMEQLTTEMKTYFQMNAADTFYNENNEIVHESLQRDNGSLCGCSSQ